MSGGFRYGTAERGSMTVEASLVLGIVLMLILSVLYTAFYLHDRAVLKETAAWFSEAMLHMAEEPVNLDGRLEAGRLESQNIFRANGYASEEDAVKAAEAFRRTAELRMLMTRVTDVRASFEGRKIRLSYTAEFRMNVGAAVSRVTGVLPSWTDETERTLGMDPEEFVRLCRGVIWRKKE